MKWVWSAKATLAGVVILTTAALTPFLPEQYLIPMVIVVGATAWCFLAIANYMRKPLAGKWEPMVDMIGRPYDQEKSDVRCKMPAAPRCGWPTCDCSPRSYPLSSQQGNCK